MTYTINLPRKFTSSTLPRGHPGRAAHQLRRRPSLGFSPVSERIGGAAPAGKFPEVVQQAMGSFTPSISPDIWVAGHEHRNAVKHVFQAFLELCVPTVLGESRCQAMHDGETPGVNLV